MLQSHYYSIYILILFGLEVMSPNLGFKIKYDFCVFVDGLIQK